MKIGEVEVTEHAWDRWCERYPGAVGLKNPDDDTLKQHLKMVYKRAKDEDLSPAARVRRMIDNRGEDAHYLFDKGTSMRFVLNADRTSLMTVEEDRFWPSDSRPSKKHFR